MSESEYHIMVPERLFELLVDDAVELLSERHWHKDEPRCGYQKAYQELEARVQEAVKIRDGLDQGSL